MTYSTRYSERHYPEDDGIATGDSPDATDGIIADTDLATDEDVAETAVEESIFHLFVESAAEAQSHHETNYEVSFNENPTGDFNLTDPGEVESVFDLLHGINPNNLHDAASNIAQNFVDAAINAAN